MQLNLPNLKLQGDKQFCRFRGYFSCSLLSSIRNCNNVCRLVMMYLSTITRGLPQKISTRAIELCSFILWFGSLLFLLAKLQTLISSIVKHRYVDIKRYYRNLNLVQFSLFNLFLYSSMRNHLPLSFLF